MNKYIKAFNELENLKEKIINLLNSVKIRYDIIEISDINDSKIKISTEYYICGDTNYDVIYFTWDEINMSPEEYKLKKEEEHKKIIEDNKRKEEQRLTNAQILREKKEKAEFKRLKKKYGY